MSDNSDFDGDSDRTAEDLEIDDDHHRLDPAAAVPDDADDDFIEYFDETDKEMTDYEGFEDATDCPDCGMVRPFGGNCIRCGWQVPDKTSSGTPRDSRSHASNRSDDLSINRLILLVVTGRSEPIATAKASAALGNRSDAGPQDGYDLVADFDDPERLFPGKWGELDDAMATDSEAGADVYDRVRQMLIDDDGSWAAEQPLVYGEDGSPVQDMETLEAALEGELALTDPHEDATVWFVPAVLYTPSASSSESSGPPTKRIRCNSCRRETMHKYRGTGAEEDDDRATEHIWECTECETPRCHAPPAE